MPGVMSNNYLSAEGGKFNEINMQNRSTSLELILTPIIQSSRR